MKTVACRLDLGLTRIAGFTLFDQDTLEFQETTPREVENLIRQGKVNGLKLDNMGVIDLDSDGWGLGNLKIKSAVGKFRDMFPEKARGDKVYSVVRVIKIDDLEPVYETINNKCARVFYSEKQIISLAQFAWVGGVKITEDDKIELCPGVKFVDWSDHNLFEINGNLVNKQTMQELFGSFSDPEVTDISPAACNGCPNVDTAVCEECGAINGTGDTEGQEQDQQEESTEPQADRAEDSEVPEEHDEAVVESQVHAAEGTNEKTALSFETEDPFDDSERNPAGQLETKDGFIIESDADGNEVSRAPVEETTSDGEQPDNNSEITQSEESSDSFESLGFEPIDDSQQEQVEEQPKEVGEAEEQAGEQDEEAENLDAQGEQEVQGSKPKKKGSKRKK